MTDILIIHPTGEIKVIRQEESPTLEQYYELLDCKMIELIYTTWLLSVARIALLEEYMGDYEMICDEEALIRTDKEPVLNKIATLYAGRNIVGTVALQPKGTLK